MTSYKLFQPEKGCHACSFVVSSTPQIPPCCLIVPDRNDSLCPALALFLAERPLAVYITVNRKVYWSKILRFGLPLQGSVLGPFLFTQYTVQVGVICRRHDIDCDVNHDTRQISNMTPKVVIMSWSSNKIGQNVYNLSRCPA